MSSTATLPDSLPDDPFHWLERWLAEATSGGVQRNPNAMTLATVDTAGRPSGRVVLCKGLDADQGTVTFYTNYQSRKCTDIDRNPSVALTFHWDALGRQVRIEGEALRTPAADSDAYFASRPRGSQLGAWGSDQSQTIASRQALIEQVEQRSAGFGGEDGDETVRRPAHWGGIRVWARAIELWMEGSDRVHDRARWERRLARDGDGFAASAWTGTRLQP